MADETRKSYRVAEHRPGKSGGYPTGQPDYVVQAPYSLHNYNAKARQRQKLAHQTDHDPSSGYRRAVSQYDDQALQQLLNQPDRARRRRTTVSAAGRSTRPWAT